MILSRMMKVAVVSTLVFTVGCADEPYESYNVKLTIYNAETGEPLPNVGLRISYSWSNGGNLFADKPEGNGRIYETDGNGQVMAVVYKAIFSDEAVTLVLSTGEVLYYISTSELEPNAKIQRTEEDRKADWREISYPINLTFEVVE